MLWLFVKSDVARDGMEIAQMGRVPHIVMKLQPIALPMEYGAGHKLVSWPVVEVVHWEFGLGC